MKTYIVDHNGSTHSTKTGEDYTYSVGKPIELPKDVVQALGSSAQPFGNEPDEEDEVTEVTEETEKEDKETKNVKQPPRDKMIKNNDVVTK